MMLTKRLSPLSQSTGHGTAQGGEDAAANYPPDALFKQFTGYDRTRGVFREQTRMLQDQALEVTADSLEQWVADHVLVDDIELHRWLDNPAGAVFATPHYGPFVGSALLFAHAGQAGRPSNIFYDSAESVPENERFDHLFERFGDCLKVLHNNPRGLMKAVRALRKGQCISILFDVVQHQSSCLFVPFFDRLYPAMGGAAYLSLLAGAPLIPAYTVPEGGQHLRVLFGNPILPEDYVGEEKDQSVFQMTCALFADFESRLRRMPWHWIYWNNVGLAPVHDEAVLRDETTLRHEFRRRIGAYPQLLTMAPSLKALLGEW